MYVIASAKEIDALNITLFSCINSTNVHLCNYCAKIFVIVVNTCVCRRSVDNKAVILSYPILLLAYRSSERALDHEKFRAIKKKTKLVKQINM